MDLLGHFVEEHVLGIITQFAHAINDFQARQPLPEKKRYILAIGEMIKIARGHVSSALPQVSLFLYVPPFCFVDADESRFVLV